MKSATKKPTWPEPETAACEQTVEVKPRAKRPCSPSSRCGTQYAMPANEKRERPKFHPSTTRCSRMGLGCVWGHVTRDTWHAQVDTANEQSRVSVTATWPTTAARPSGLAADR